MKPGGLPGEDVEVDLRGQRLAAGVDLEDLLAALAVGAVDDDLAVEAARPQQRRIEDVRPVGGGDEDDVVLHLEAVHLDEQLVQRLLALVVAAAHAGASVAADGVDLVHEDDAGGVLFGLLEEVADAAGADADEHLDEVRSRDREEGDPGLAGDRAGEQRLAGAGRAVEQHALGDPGAQGLELLRVLQELLDLVQLLHGLVYPSHISEGDLGRVHRHSLGARLAEAHHPRAAALHLVHQEDPEGEEQQEGQDVGEQREDAAAALALDLVVDLVSLQRVLELSLRGVGVEEARLVLVAVLLLDLEGVVLGLERHLLDLAVLHLGDELVVGGLFLGFGRADQALGEKRQHDDDQDRKGCAAEKTFQGVSLNRELRGSCAPG